jgi:hypothetical protein
VHFAHSTLHGRRGKKNYNQNVAVEARVACRPSPNEIFIFCLFLGSLRTWSSPTS